MRSPIHIIEKRSASRGSIGLALVVCLLGFVHCSSDEERGPIGLGNPAEAYCTGIGYTLNNGSCLLPGGASCEEWSFYRGQCGQSSSYCNLHGGSISPATVDMGASTSILAICSLPNGSQCEEETYWRTGKCP